MSDKEKTFFNGKWCYSEQELRNAVAEADINEARRQESEKRHQNFLLCLYEMKKEISYLQYETSNYYPKNLEKNCIRKAYEYVSDKFPEFQMPQEAVELYV